MRLWSLNPKYLDRAGLLAVWREGLLARKVLLGETVGYKNHPQLIRFKQFKNPVKVIDAYLNGILEEASERNYNFDSTKIKLIKDNFKIPLNQGQLQYEFSHLLKKLEKRDRLKYLELKKLDKITPHKIFKLVPGEIEDFEKVIE
ncbi:MAG: pyrimidine dimer DNA glycosylase/endonuclease V [Candidatus Falkowbacteria bacterium]